MRDEIGRLWRQLGRRKKAAWPRMEQGQYRSFRAVHPFDERFGLEFRAELFNAFNRVQFNPPNTSCCGGASFGQITSQYNLPRIIQFALRTTF